MGIMKKLLIGLLLGVSLCLVPVLGYGEIMERGMSGIDEHSTRLDFCFLRAEVWYMMRNPNTYEAIYLVYDKVGKCKECFGLPEGVETKGKVFMTIDDIRGLFSYKKGTALKEAFKSHLETFYSYISEFVTDMNSDVVVVFYSKGGIPLGYFYQGEYHLWEGESSEK